MNDWRRDREKILRGLVEDEWNTTRDNERYIGIRKHTGRQMQHSLIQAFPLVCNQFKKHYTKQTHSTRSARHLLKLPTWLTTSLCRAIGVKCFFCKTGPFGEVVSSSTLEILVAKPQLTCHSTERHGSNKMKKTALLYLSVELLSLLSTTIAARAGMGLSPGRALRPSPKFSSFYISALPKDAQVLI